MMGYDVSAAAALGWLLTFLAYSSLILGGAWGCERLRRRELSETAWRLVVIAALAVAIPAPLRYVWTIPVPQPATETAWTASEAAELRVDPSARADSNEMRAANTPNSHSEGSVASTSSNTLSNAVAPAPAGNIELVRTLARSADSRASRSSRHTPSQQPASSARQFGAASATLVTTPGDLLDSADDARRAIDLSWAAALATSWLVIAAAWLAKLAWDYARAVRGFGWRIALPSGHRCHDLLNALCSAAGVAKTPRLTTSNTLASPVSLIRNEICIPLWALDELDDAQLQGLLAHELAHQRRGDPWLFLALQVIERVFWMQPLYRLAHARLRALAELSADDWASARTRNGPAIASTIYACVARSRQAPAFGIAIVAQPSVLVQRVQRLLAASATERKSMGRAASTALGCAAFAIALALPAFEMAQAQDARVPAPRTVPQPAQPAQPAPEPRPAPQPAQRSPASPAQPAPPAAPSSPSAPAGPVSAPAVSAARVSVPETPAARRLATSGTSVHELEIDGENEFRSSSDGRVLKARWNGDFELNDDESDVTHLARGTSLEIETRSGGDKRRIEFAERDGSVERTYYVDGKERPLDDDGRAWLAATLKEVLQSSSVHVHERVARFLAQGGPDAVLAEMDELRGTYPLRLYSEELMAQADLTDAQVRGLLARLARAEGDYDLRTVLTTLFEHERVAPAVLPDVIAVAKRIESDYDLRIVLETIARQPMTESVVDAWRELAAGIESDYDLREAVVAALRSSSVEGDGAAQLLEVAAASIESDYDLSQVVLSAPQVEDSEAASAAAIRALDAIESSYDRRVTAEHLVSAGRMDPKNWRALIGAVASIDSDYDRAEALTHIAASMPLDAETTAAYRKASESIDSEYDRTRALAAQSERSGNL